MVPELIAAAISKLRRRETPGNVAAVLYREWPLRGDGRRWTFCVTDGLRVAWVDATLSRTSGVAVTTVSQTFLEAAVERQAVNAYPVESRMDDLVSSAPLTLRAEDLRPHPNLSVFF
jgi:hypothetical protein